MKKCPYCAEEIQDEAILCRYCRSDLRNLNDKKDEKVDIKSVIEQFDYSCPRCGQGISAKAIQCKNCGQYINREKGLSNFMKEVHRSKTENYSSKSEGINKNDDQAETGVYARVPAPSFESEKLPNPPLFLTIVFMVGLIVIQLIIGFLLGVFYPGSMSDLESITSTFSLVFRIIVSIIAVSGTNQKEPKWWVYIGFFLFSLIPFAGWILLFWAGKAIARKAAKTTSI